MAIRVAPQREKSNPGSRAVGRLVSWIEEQVRRGYDEILDRGVFCIHCKAEMVRTRNVGHQYRHIDTGTVTCMTKLRRDRELEGRTVTL